jgi:hypothetical protein
VPPVEDGGLPPDVCDRVPDVERTNASLSAPDVFENDATRLREIFGEERHLLEAIADHSTGDLQRRLRRQVRSQPAVSEAILERWDQTRGPLADEHDDGPWPPKILDDVVHRSDGAEVDVDEFFGLAYSNYQELVVRCRAPALADLPREEMSELPPPGRLMYLRRAPDRQVELVMSDTRGGNLRRVDDIAPWQVRSGLDAGRGGDDPVVVGARDGDEFGLVVLDESGTVAQVAVTGSGQHDLVCQSWNDRGDQILAMRNTSDIDDRRLHLTDLTGDRTSRPLDLPFAVVGCSAFISDDRLVVGDAALTVDGARGVWTVGIDGSEPRELYSPVDCATGVGSVDPSATRVAIHQRCLDPTADGLWIVDLSSGEADHVVTANTGPPKWSPDGTWLVFGLQPFIGRRTSTVWMARADGDQLRQITDEPAWTPVWLPPR